ncbi:hypothetical protein CBR_g52392, partial [Chara braunii]
IPARTDLWAEFRTQIPEVECYVFAGDFNTTIHPGLDSLQERPPTADAEALQLFMAELDCVDVYRTAFPAGREFAWYGSANRRSRIDMVWASSSIFRCRSEIAYLPTTLSDHVKVAANFPVGDIIVGHPQPSLPEWVFQDEEYKPLIQQHWDNWLPRRPQGMDELGWVAQGNALMRRCLHDRLAGSYGAHLATGQEYADRLSALNCGPKDEQTEEEWWVERVEAVREWQEWETVEIARKGRRSKVGWTVVGEKMSRRFFRELGKKQGIALITAMDPPFDLQQARQETTLEILDCVTDFYADLFTEGEGWTVEQMATAPLEHIWRHVPPGLTEEQAQPLEMDITLEEVLRAIGELPRLKAPGVDGVPIEMYKAPNHFFGPLLTRAFNEALHAGHLPEGFADAFVVLIYKKGAREDVRNWHPISILNAHYKILAKLRAAVYKYLWAGDVEVESVIPRVAWSKLTQPRSQGELGILDPELQMTALQLRNLLWFLLGTAGTAWESLTTQHLALALGMTEQMVLVALASPGLISHVKRNQIWSAALTLWKKLQLQQELPVTVDDVYNQLLFDNPCVCDDTGDPFPWKGKPGAVGKHWAECGVFKVGHLWDEEERDWRKEADMVVRLPHKFRRRQNLSGLQRAIPTQWVDTLRVDHRVGGEWVRLKGETHPLQVYQITQVQGEEVVTRAWNVVTGYEGLGAPMRVGPGAETRWRTDEIETVAVCAEKKKEGGLGSARPFRICIVLKLPEVVAPWSRRMKKAWMTAREDLWLMGRGPWKGMIDIEGSRTIIYMAPSTEVRDWLIHERKVESILVGCVGHEVQLVPWRTPAEMEFQREEEKRQRPWVKVFSPSSFLVPLEEQMVQQLFGEIVSIALFCEEEREYRRYVVRVPLKMRQVERVAVAFGPTTTQEFRFIMSETPFCDVCSTHGHLGREGRCLSRAESARELQEKEIRRRMEPILASNVEEERRAWREIEQRYDAVVLKELQAAHWRVGGPEVAEGYRRRQDSKPRGRHTRPPRGTGGGRHRDPPVEVHDRMEINPPVWIFGDMHRKRKECQEDTTKGAGVEVGIEKRQCGPSMQPALATSRTATTDARVDDHVQPAEVGNGWGGGADDLVDKEVFVQERGSRVEGSNEPLIPIDAQSLSGHGCAQALQDPCA